MLIISKITKVFVPCPAGACTGGAELLHQVVDVINNHGGKAYIVYFGADNHNLPSDYSKYNIRFADHIEDKKENIVLIYEGYYKEVFHITNSQIILWWLSVDNYFLCNRLTIPELLCYQFSHYPIKLGWKGAIKMMIKDILWPRDAVSLRRLKSASVVYNCYQSEYAKSFLKEYGFRNLYPLKDYINEDNFSYDYKNNSKKTDTIVYNPKKGYKFTQKLITYDKSLKWIPIINLPRRGVIELLRSAKVYVDFGYHPGKDRLPREAAINGCCIVTGKEGSAGFKDIDIPEIFKHNQHDTDIPSIISQLHDLIEHYDERFSEFKYYRECVKNEKQEFVDDIVALFHLL
ncbi:MAG: hypothetical protein LKI18_04145 [Prevotella sp.]|jgi:hypothetical protein|nr:hypothetical protein [Prevotella sp.]